MEKIIEVKKLRKVFGEKNENVVRVLNDIDFSMKYGEFVAIMGQSGSGKSTFLYQVSGMDSVSSGEVLFAGKNISNLKEEDMSKLRLTKMGFVFQNSYLLGNMDIYDNIILPGLKANKGSKEAVKKRGEELMIGLGIDHIADHDINKVSGGQLQRAAICRALINNPDILFADEPTGALNSSTTDAVMDIFRNIHEGNTAILLVTHDAKVAARAEHVVFIEDGKIKSEFNLGVFNGSEKELIEREKKMKEFLEEQGF